jgi:hypothetical protein
MSFAITFNSDPPNIHFHRENYSINWNDFAYDGVKEVTLRSARGGGGYSIYLLL